MKARGARSALLVILVWTFACGKKGDPQPPIPRGPNAVSDLATEQEGGEAVLTFSFPDRLLTGAPLTDLASIEIYRVVRPSSALLAPKKTGPAAPPTTSATGPGVVNVPGGAGRRAATNVRLAEEAFYREARLAASLPLAAIAELTRGASVVYRDSLSPLWTKGQGPEPLAYAVVSVRRDGERSPLSNIATLLPAVPPEAPVLVAAIPEEGRVCLEWSAPEKDILGQPVSIRGYEIYRRILPQEEYEAPLNAKPVTGTTYVDTTAPYGAALVYTIRATLEKNPKVEGLPAEELGLFFRDVFPPPPPARLDALSEGNLVRLLWDPVDAPDLAGYVVYRAEAAGAPMRLSKETISDPFYTDESVEPGKRYRYTVHSIDRAGNESGPSPEAVAEPF
ncbi:MAG TPA: hypothetical protein VGL03_01750 [Thermoanaerobaculia bacterium]